MRAHEPVRPALHAVLSILTIVTEMSVDPDYADEVAAESELLGDVINMAHVILDLSKLHQKRNLQ